MCPNFLLKPHITSSTQKPQDLIKPNDQKVLPMMKPQSVIGGTLDGASEQLAIIDMSATSAMANTK